MQKIKHMLGLILMLITIFAIPCISLTYFASNTFNLQTKKINPVVEYNTNTPFLIHKNLLLQFDAKLPIDKSTQFTLVKILAQTDFPSNSEQSSKTKSANLTIDGYMYVLVLLLTLPLIAVALILIVPHISDLLIEKQNHKEKRKQEQAQKTEHDEML